MARKDARFDECPVVCGQTLKPAGQFCSGCPLTKEDKRFKKETLAELKFRLDADSEKFSLDFLLQMVFDVLEIESDSTDDLFIGTETLVNILKTERNKIDRIEHQDLLAKINPKAGKQEENG